MNKLRLLASCAAGLVFMSTSAAVVAELASGKSFQTLQSEIDA